MDTACEIRRDQPSYGVTNSSDTINWIYY